MFAFYADYKLAVWITAILATIAMCILHYFLNELSHTKKKKYNQDIMVKRFSVGEIVLHWLRIILFVFLLITGFKMLLLPEGLGDLGPHHGFPGLVFVIISIINLLLWRHDTMFNKYDWVWLRNFGGYLSKQPVNLPAGRFNAGQKIYYWLMFIATIFLLITAIIMQQEPHQTMAARQSLSWILHGVIACFTSMLVIVHIYLAFFVNPEITHLLWYGKISSEYIMEHHPQSIIKG